ncbi:SRPBCC family protein [Reyranella sp.]|uniref:SRPBCC family protein n=1 Tax=Reyranella sp. TaxID=1929291 RepID=UPI003D14DDC6
MLKILGIAVLVVVVAIAGVLIYASTRPDSFRVERSVSINAPADGVYPLIADFRRWAEWSPYEKKDPAMKRTFGSITAGKGATYAWDGDKNVGQGSMEILEASQPSKVVIKLDFQKPFEAHNTAEFTLKPKGDGTEVTWAIHGPSPLISKVVSLFMNMDTMIGKDFEAGLANLKALAEKK